MRTMVDNAKISKMEKDIDTLKSGGSSGGSGLSSPWTSDDKSLGINDQGVRSGLINMGNGGVGYGDIVYNNENMFTLLSVMLMSGNKSLNDIITYIDTVDGIQSFVKLPADFKTNSQTINLNFNLYRHIIEIEYGNEGYKIAFQTDLTTDEYLNSFEKIRKYLRGNTLIASGIVSKPGVVDPIAAQLISLEDDASTCMITDVLGNVRSIKDLATYGPNKDDYLIRITDIHIKKIGGLVDYEPVPGPK